VRGARVILLPARFTYSAHFRLGRLFANAHSPNAGSKQASRKCSNAFAVNHSKLD
jgi:hypothetical protein